MVCWCDYYKWIIYNIDIINYSACFLFVCFAPKILKLSDEILIQLEKEHGTLSELTLELTHNIFVFPCGSSRPFFNPLSVPVLCVTH